MGLPRGEDSDPAAENLSQQAHRRLIGVLGFCLPILLYIFAGLLPTAGLPSWRVLSSVSAYYYTGGVAVFIGVLFALALFLLTYRGYKGVIADRVLGFVGGSAALLVALFPTTAPRGLVGPSWWGRWMAVLATKNAWGSRTGGPGSAADPPLGYSPQRPGRADGTGTASPSHTRRELRWSWCGAAGAARPLGRTQPFR